MRATATKWSYVCPSTDPNSSNRPHLGILSPTTTRGRGFCAAEETSEEGDIGAKAKTDNQSPRAVLLQFPHRTLRSRAGRRRGEGPDSVYQFCHIGIESLREERRRGHGSGAR